MHGPTGVFVLLVLVSCVGVAMAGNEAGTLVSTPDGGWQTVGLPYVARISPEGYLESLRVEGFEFLAPSQRAEHGLFLADGDQPSPFTMARRNAETLTVGNADAHLTLRFLPDRIQITASNISMSESHCVRMDLCREVARIKDPDTGAEYALPPSLISGRMRVIAPNGASVTLPGQYLVPLGKAYHVKLPYVRPGGPEATFELDIAGALRLGDRVKVSVKAQTDDFTYWSGSAQPLYTELANMMPDDEFHGAAVLRLNAYLTKTVAQEMRQPLDLEKAGTAALTWTLAELDPGLFIAELWVARGNERGLCSSRRLVFNASALLPPDPPADFDEFWRRTLDEQAKIPLDLRMTKVKDQGLSEVHKFSFAGLLGYRCYGYLTVPQDKSKKYPAVLILPSSGLHRIAAPSFPEGDRAAMAINITNMDVDLPDDEYDWRTWPAPYLVTGILDRDYYSLRFSYASMVRAAEVLAARPEVQPDNILVTGSSQGGGLTLVAAGLWPNFKAAVANVPGLCRLDWNLEYLQPPYFPIAASTETRPLISRTLSYYDAVPFARRIKCPIWVSLGLYDDVTPSVGVFCAYNVIPHEQKELLVQPLTGHGGGYNYTDAAGPVWP